VNNNLTPGQDLSHEVVVVIPVYKPTMTADERIAFERCHTVLGRYPITLAAPEGLDLSAYYAAGERHIARFAPAFFASIAGYNRLMLSSGFYEHFSDYRYLLIYQLDAFVFADRLAEWCASGYDYIGAPWIGRSLWRVMLHISRVWPPTRPRLKGLRNRVGNGGLSLRRVESHLACLRRYRAKAAHWDINEDYFWSLYVPWSNPAFRIPSYREALSFAFETQPEACLVLNQGQLPFGCHGWDKYDRAFWRPVFGYFGYAI
jgi:hypothetical protein